MPLTYSSTIDKPVPNENARPKVDIAFVASASVEKLCLLLFPLESR